MQKTRLFLAAFLLLASAFQDARARNGATFDFNDGLVPGGTTIPNTASGYSLANLAVGVTNAGGCTNSPCLILTEPGVGTTYGQWRITNALNGAAAITNFTASFQLFMGDGSGGNASVPNAGGNGFVFHVGPTPPAQFNGSDSTWGNGLDVSFRSYKNGVNTTGINIAYNAVSKSFNPGAGTIIAINPSLEFFQTNGAADSFPEAVTVTVTLTNGALSLTCSNAAIGNVTVYNSLTIPGFVPISPALMAFSATDGNNPIGIGSVHEVCSIDNVDLTVNGTHIAPVHGTGPPQIIVQPASVTVSETGGATFSVVATGPAPYTYQWLSNGVPTGSIQTNGALQMFSYGFANYGATTSSWNTGPVTCAMNGTVYSVVVSNAFGAVSSIGATLLVLPGPRCGQMVVSNGSGGRSLSFTVSNWSGGIVYSTTNLAAPSWVAVAGGTNSQFTLPISPTAPESFYTVCGTNQLFVTNCTRFFSPWSFWNIPIGSNPMIDLNSTAMVAASLTNFTPDFGFITLNYGVALAYACATNKVYTIPATMYDSPACAPGGPGVNFPIPAGTQVAPGTDGHLVVIYPALDGSPYAGKELNMWQGVYDATNDTWSASTVAVEDLYGWGAACPPGGLAGSCDASGLALLGGAVRPEEIAQGHIDHALAIATPRNLEDYIACPGTGTDGTFASPALPEGAQIQLDPTFDVAAQNWPQWEKTIACALQTYGAYNRDTGGWVTIYGVTDQNPGVPTWASCGVPEDPSLSDLPWGRMRVIAIHECASY